ncbi:MAG: hypothetical protein GY741_14600, partial [Phycisphaeraceae bacterium]|nr:hypothetical protein [Phycisphaeraceae bacterium]
GRELGIERPDDGSLVVELAGLHPFEHATVIKLELDGAARVDQSVRPDAAGVLRLLPREASLEGPGLRVEQYPDSASVPIENLGYWSSTEASASWSVRLEPGRRYEVAIDLACSDKTSGGRLELACGDQVIEIPVPATGGWDRFEIRGLGDFTAPEIDSASEVVLRATSIPGEAVANVRGLVFRPIE